ncbi:unnamed protein product [Darwinula stevensoni]|uniref:Retinoblastoma-like protein 1 n=1 Tax=Darwinula stevensoni TaxID=69355 RepID=A0A7R9A5B7_9CRUS|nr:unnamed protein product [Darwinula stevensoni]CAG0894061.1 unnamed protein product [Darwinula stevensoni]
MGQGQDEDIWKMWLDVCADLNMDKNTAEDAYQSYNKISQNYTLEGNPLHWLACAFYVACRKSSVPAVGNSSSVVEGNYVSLMRLLKSCQISITDFFKKAKKWVDMANSPASFREKIERLEHNFAVSKVLFQKFIPIFLQMFKDPANDPPRPPRSRKQRTKLPCSSKELMEFTWLLFVYIKGHFPAIRTDLVNSYHLLMACCDLVFGNALLDDRRDIIRDSFGGLPQNYHSTDYQPPKELPCTIELLCKSHDGIVLEAKGIKEHWCKPRIKILVEKKILKGKSSTFSGLLDPHHMEHNMKMIKKEYDVAVLNGGDFDEMIFLQDDPALGVKDGNSGTAELTSRMREKREKQQPQSSPQKVHSPFSLVSATPLTGRMFLKAKEGCNTPISNATHSVSKLQKLLQGHTNVPSETLISVFKNCQENSLTEIQKRLKVMGDAFCESFTQPSENHPGSDMEFARKRLQLGESLYYKALESVLLAEQKRLNNDSADLTNLLSQDALHRCLFACCMEIVIFSYNSQRSFPWILEVLNLEPYIFYRIIEVYIRAENQLSRDIVKHLNAIEEQVFESLAWKSDSPLWEKLQEVDHVPSCEEVSLPSQLSITQSPSQLSSSPLSHLTPGSMVSADKNPPSRSSPVRVAECFQSPVPPNSARRRLFEQAPITIATATIPNTNLRGERLALALPVFPDMHSAKPMKSILITNEKKHTSNIDGKKDNKPRKGSLHFFLRKFYHLASVRLQHLCQLLEINEIDLQRKIWTCFEHSITNYYELMMDRHLDQLLMCSVYIMCKITREDRTFQEIMRCYRLQPQACSHVYRSVLLRNKRRRGSGSSDSQSSSEKEDSNGRSSEETTSMRSSSTLPQQPPSAPPTPTQLAGTSSSFELEDRGDLISFYNAVYMQKLKPFAMRFSTGNGREPTGHPPLSPLMVSNKHHLSPRRKVANDHEIYVSPLGLDYKNLVLPYKVKYSFNRSAGQELQAINNLVRLSKARKHLLPDDGTDEPPIKRPASCDPMSQKLQDVMTELKMHHEPVK